MARLSCNGPSPQGHYLYRHSISARDADGNSLELAIPEGIENEDEFLA